MNRAEWKLADKRSLHLFHYYNDCKKYWKSTIEQMKLKRPGVKIVIHHDLCEFNDLHYELWDVNHTKPMYTDEHTKLHTKIGTGWKKNVSSWNFGKKMSEETKDKVKKSVTAYYETHDGPNKGRQFDEAFREKARKGSTGRKQSQETIDKRRKKLIGQTRTISEDGRKHMREAAKGKIISQSHRESLSKAIKGRSWYTNGVEDKMLFEALEGWWKGRTNFKYPKTIKTN